jgi:glycosyltransferase involved in cell wall biosynthesis
MVQHPEGECSGAVESTMKTVVTVGVCVRDCEASVGEAVESVLGQDFPHELMELIAVVGHSRDNTLIVVKESLSKGNVRSRVFCENEGLGAARQIVVDNAMGDYVVWVDCDISLTSDYVREQVEFMERNPRVGIAKGIEAHKGGSLVAVLEGMKPLIYRFRNWKELLIVPTGGAVYRVEAIKKAGGFDRSIRGAFEDGDMGIRIQGLGWITAFSDSVFYHKPRQTWQALWQEYFWWGYGAHFVRHKHGKRSISFWYTLPPIAFTIGFAHSVYAYRLTHKLVSVLLPVQYFFKDSAWCLGYVHGHLDRYGHPGPTRRR